MKNIYHNFYRKIIFNASALSRGEISSRPWRISKIGALVEQ